MAEAGNTPTVEKGGAQLVLTGRFLGIDLRHWKNKNTGEKGQTVVLVFEGDTVAYPELVKVGKDSVDRAKLGAPTVGSLGRASVFASNYGELWFKEWVQ